VRLPAPYKCDVCGKQKGESNHWWLRQRNLADLHVFVLLPWDAAAPDIVDVAGVAVYEHICSESCAIKSLSQYMARMQPKPGELPRLLEELSPADVVEIGKA
jgi:hypothetical protein